MVVIVHVGLKRQMIQNVYVKSLENKKVVSAIVDYMLKSNDERVVINDYIENDPLSENNLDKTIDLVNEFRLSFPMKSIWIYSGYKFEDCILKDKVCEENISRALRYEIIKQCTVMVDGQYIDSQKDISLPYRGSKNQRLINVKESIEKGEVILWKC